MSLREAQLLIGVDVGLHSIHTIIVREEGDNRLRLMGTDKTRTITEPDETVVILRVQESIKRAIEDAKVRISDILAIGVALPGQIDTNKGIVLFSPLLHVRDHPIALVEKLREHIEVPFITLISNDNAYGLGEQRIGEGKQIKDLVHLRIGYNLGASIIINNEPYFGADNFAGAFPHMVIDLHGKKCSCNNYGCLETLVSREAIQKELRRRYEEGEATLLAAHLEQVPLDITATVITQALDQGDVLTRQVVEEAAEVLGIGIANVINFLNPHRIILGGDVADEVELFFQRAVASAKRRSLNANQRNVSIVHGKLGTIAAAYGAAVFAKERLMSQQGPIDTLNREDA